MTKINTSDKSDESAIKLLQISEEKEGEIVSRISTWLSTNNIDNYTQYPTGAGPVDLHLKHRNCIIEVKKYSRLKRGPMKKGTGSKQDESAFEQLVRYLDVERNQLRLTTDDNNVPWIGVITDGRRWWVWQWPIMQPSGADRQKGDVSPKQIMAWDGTEVTHSNLDLLKDVFDRKTNAKPWVADDPSSLFIGFRTKLTELYDANKRKRDTKIQKRLWLEQLKGSGNHPDAGNEDGLFVVHTMLILISRMVSGKKPKDASTGNVDDDLTAGFIKWTAKSTTLLNNLYDTINRFDWGPNRGDVLRDLYKAFIPKEQRRGYGEYYTPDWLAEKICADVIDDNFIRMQIENFKDTSKDVLGVMDPACGSGTFLYHAVKLIIESKPMKDSQLSIKQRIDFICSMIYGMDIHPVAVEMSLANILRILGNIPSEKLHIYQGDSLLLQNPHHSVHSNETNMVLYTRDNGGEKNNNGSTVILPRVILPDRLMIKKFVETAVNRKPLPRYKISNRCTSSNSGKITLTTDEHEMLKKAHDSLIKIIESDGNGVWAWYIHNQAAPLLLSSKNEKKIGRIVSNPPWVNMNDITDKARQDAVKALGLQLELYVGQQRATQFDIASVFVKRCMVMYMNTNSKAGWVLPQMAARGGGQWEKLRDRYKVKKVWDLGTLAFPENAESSTLFIGMRGNNYMLKLKPKKPRPEKRDGWNYVKTNLIFTDMPREFDPKQSAWFMFGKKPKTIARNGATIFPHSLIKPKPESIMPVDGEKSMVRFTTVAARHGVWKTQGTKSGTISKSWIKMTVTGADIIPYAIATTTNFIIPINKKGEWIAGRDNDPYWSEVSKDYADGRGSGDSTPKTLEDRINHMGALKSQFSGKHDKHVVVYNKSGSRLYAAINHDYLVVENSAYRVSCKSEKEALFLCGILNADCMQEAFRWSKEASRHYDVYLWHKIPIPRYNDRHELHRKLVSYVKKAQKTIQVCNNRNNLTRKTAVILLQAPVIKPDNTLPSISERIDKIVTKLLPKYTTG